MTQRNTCELISISERSQLDYRFARSIQRSRFFLGTKAEALKIAQGYIRANINKLGDFIERHWADEADNDEIKEVVANFRRAVRQARIDHRIQTKLGKQS